MDVDELVINSTACNEFTRHRGEREKIAADVDALQYFNQVATYHFIPLLNDSCLKVAACFIVRLHHLMAIILYQCG